MKLHPATLIFAVDLAALVVLLAGVCWSIARPARRIWPPPGRRSWQYAVTWLCFGLVFGGNAALILLDWGSGPLNGPLRLALGIPFALIGGLLVVWGFRTLGAGNTSGLRQGFVRAGPYRLTRNPQYVGDMLLFLGHFDLATGEEIVRLAPNGPGIFSADGRTVYAPFFSAGTLSIRLLTVNLEDTIALARERLTRGLSDAECVQYLHLEDGCPAP